MKPDDLKTIGRELAGYRSLASALGSSRLTGQVAAASSAIITALKRGRKVLIFGNGGSAAEAQHFAAELVGRFGIERRGLPAIALTTDSSILTAQANDGGYHTVFSRQIEALVRPGDIVFGMTTSDAAEDHSRNILEGFLEARRRRAKTVGLFSAKTKRLLKAVDCPIVVPHTETPRIQEVHLLVIHILCRLVDEHFAKQR